MSKPRQSIVALYDFLVKFTPQHDELWRRFRELDAMDDPPDAEVVAVIEKIVELQGQYQALTISARDEIRNSRGK